MFVGAAEDLGTAVNNGRRMATAKWDSLPGEGIDNDKRSKSYKSENDGAERGRAVSVVFGWG